MTASRLAWTVGAVLATASVGAAAQTGLPPPEPPARIPRATTLPSLRSVPSPGAEAPAHIPHATKLPSMRKSTLGAEPPASMPSGATLPSYRLDPPTAPAAPPATAPRRPIVVPNGNGTSTIIELDGSVRTVPTPR